MINLIPTALRAGISAERIMEIVRLPRESMEEKDLAEAIKKTGKESGVFIRMSHVDFQYQEGKWVYQNADFLAKPGEIVALIGPSGQGRPPR